MNDVLKDIITEQLETLTLSELLDLSDQFCDNIDSMITEIDTILEENKNK